MGKKGVYIAITALGGRDQLRYLSHFKVLKFESIFGKINDNWIEHEKAVEWILIYGKLIDFCICVTPTA